MTYWGSFSISNQNLSQGTANLVKYADGWCGAWSPFFTDVLGVQGISAPGREIQPPSGYWRMVLNTNMPAQNNPSPQFVFWNHAVNEYGGKIYDPSYGNTWNTQLSWEDACVNAYLTNLSYTVGIFDTKGVQETVWP